MTWSAAVTELTAAHASAWGEPTDLTPKAGVIPVRVTAVWGEVRLNEPGERSVADRCDVLVPAASLTDGFGDAVPVGRLATLTRYPDELVGAEVWQVEKAVRLDAASYRLACVLQNRPAPKGPR